MTRSSRSTASSDDPYRSPVGASRIRALGKAQTEVFRFDEPGRVGDCAGNQAREAFGQVSPAGRHVKRGGQIAVLVKNRRGRAKQARVAGEEMLIAINGHGALVDDAGADAVGAFVLLAPDAASPKAGAFEEGIVARRAAPVDDDPARVSQHDRTPDAADGEKEAIDASLRGEEQASPSFRAIGRSRPRAAAARARGSRDRARAGRQTDARMPRAPSLRRRCRQSP